MIVHYNEAVAYLENLQIMPKSMPGLQKIKAALDLTDWYKKIDPNKVIVVSGTNGKGTTCAALERLLIEARQKVGFYSSPHLISTTERIRINGQQLSQKDFVELFNDCLPLIEKCQLTHFEALTLMAGHYFFSSKWNSDLDFVILEVGLGGTYDATNAFPHKYCGITKLGVDHTNILGVNLLEIAKNKFGIVSNKNIVVHHALPEEVLELKKSKQKETNSNWVEAEKYELTIKNNSPAPRYFLKYNNVTFEINLMGARAAENIMTAISLFQVLGFDSDIYYKGLNKISWAGRMQKTEWPDLKCPLYLSGDHNLQGVESLLEILKDFKWKTLHLIVGIGVDKDADQMLKSFYKLNNVILYLTETPFKGLKINAYPEHYTKIAVEKNADVIALLNGISSQAQVDDLVLVTGSLYLVGEVLKELDKHASSENPL